MNMFYTRLASGIIAIATIAAYVFFVSPALAQDETPEPVATTEPTDVPSTTSSESASATTTPLDLNASDFFALVLTILISAVLMWGFLFDYTYRIQERYFDAFERIAKVGASVGPSDKGPEAFLGGIGINLLLKRTPEELRLTVDGPTSITVGSESSEYKIKSEEQFAIINWSVDPKNAAAVNPGDKPTTKLVAAMSGAFTLNVAAKVNANDPDDKIKKGSLSVAAITPQTSPKIELPAVGRAYGTIAITLIILVIALILGLAQILPGASIGTLLGTLAAYVFAKTVTNSSDGGNSSGNPPANSNL